MKSQWLNFVICSMLTLLLSYSCNNDDFAESPHNGLENTGSKIQKNVISGQNFLSKYNLQKNSPIFKSIKIKGFDYPPVSKSTSNQNTITIDSDEVVEFITDTVKTYTFPVLEGTLDYPQNLILQTFDDTNFKAFLVTYDPTEEWLNNTDTLYQGKKFIEEFSGQINPNKSSAVTCHLAVEAIWRCEVGYNHPPGYPNCNTENPEFLGYEWVRTCSNGPGGGFGNPNWTNPGDTWNPYEPEDPINGGGSSSNAGGTTTDTYNLPTDPVDLEELERQVQLRKVRDCLAIVLTPQDNIWLEEQSTAFLTKLNNLPNMGCSGLALIPPYQTLWQAVDEIILDDLSNICLKKIFKELRYDNQNKKGSEAFEALLKDFNDEFSVVDLRLENDDNFTTTYQGTSAINQDGDALGITIPVQNPLNNTGDIRIVFNTDPNTTINNEDNFFTFSDAQRVVLMVHELIHANMQRYLLLLTDTDMQYVSSKGYTAEEWRVYILNLQLEFLNLQEEYTHYKYSGFPSPEPTIDDHNHMAEEMRDIIKKVLTQMFPTLNDNQKEALSWGGLKKTIAYRQKQLTYGNASAIIYADPSDPNSTILASEWDFLFIEFHTNLVRTEFDTNNTIRICD